VIVHRRLTTLIALLACCLLVVSACGQKAGVHLASNGGSGGGDGGSDLGSGDGSGSGDSALGGGTSGGGTSGGGSTAGGTSGGGTSGGTGGGTSGGASGGGTSGGTGGGTSGPVDRTGVTADTVTIGIHAPATGAGAPAASFQNYYNYYFEKMGAVFNGRKVIVKFEDDGYTPSQARAACKKLIQEQKVFLLVGGGGTDQIVECARYADSVGVPYLAEGVTEAGVNTLKRYFAESMSYKAQGVLLAKYIKAKTARTKVAMIRGNTANFEDAHTGFIGALAANGLTKIYDKAVPKDADNNTMASEATAFCKSQGGAVDKSDVVLYPLMSPKLFIAFGLAAAQQNCFPRYAGIGITLGLDVVAKALCDAAYRNGATFFSPYQALDQADPAFKQALAKDNKQDADDIAYALWAAEKLLGEQIRAGGKDLSRQSFVSGILSTKLFDVGTYPKVVYNNTRFGGTAVHVLEADCSGGPGTGHYKTQSQNNTGF
jgi:ABC-type branched-subunit amino acid transport system substrate-binding protein